MRAHWMLPIPLLLLPGILHAQVVTPPPEADKADKPLGTYSLVVTTSEPSPATHLLNPPFTIELEAATPAAPKEIAGTKTVPPQYAIEAFGNPRYDCIESAAQSRGCQALDRADLSIRDPNTVAWHLANHGAAVQLQLNLQVHDLQPVSRTAIENQWHAQQVIFVPVPRPTTSFHFLSAVLVGDWNGNAVVFEPGKPLPDVAKKALDDLGIHQDLGDKILYSYKVKDPKASK
jgi:hypothetical protein